MFRKHKPPDANDSRAEIRKYARWALSEAGVGNRLPTPVDEIVACANLAVSKDISLSEIHQGFFSKAYGILTSALSKLRAVIDLQENTIYLDLSMAPQRVNFAKLHDCGHSILPWQRNAYRYEDDDQTLSPEVEAQFEKEANRFAAETMFQIDRFTKEAADLPLALKTPMNLSKRYGASCHAAIRRYVENNYRACVVLICSQVPSNGSGGLLVEHPVYSPPFIERFGGLQLPSIFDPDHPFSQLACERHVKFFEDGGIHLTDGNSDPVRVKFHIFNSSYRVFIFLYPLQSPRTGWRKVIRF